ncbi:hypothetical protein ACFV6F_22060, partial [Kitasatospora phosalacinea]
MTRPPTAAAPRTDDAPVLLVLFGATGDLARRMLFPALFELRERGLLPDRFAVIGSGRHSPGTDEDFRRQVVEALADSADADSADADSADGGRPAGAGGGAGQGGGGTAAPPGG